MNVLAVYGSNYGQAEAVVRRVAAVLEARGHTVDVVRGDAAARSAVADHDAVVVAASIIVGRYQGYIRSFAKRHRAALSDRPTAFLSVSGAGPESSAAWRAEAERYVSAFVAETGWQPRWTATFAGALRFRRYGLVTRWIMQRISRQKGGPTDTSQDYEFTDWDAVDRFGAMLAEGLAGGGGPATPA